MNRLVWYSRSFVACTLIYLLAACGQSGPLYIPGDPSTISVPPSENSGAADEDEEDAPPEKL